MKRVWPRALCAAAAAGPLLGIFGRWNWFLDLFSHFLPQQTALLAAVILFLFFRSEFKKALFLLPVFTVCAAALWSAGAPFMGLRTAAASAAGVGLFTANVRRPTAQYDRLIAEIRRSNPDIIVLEEFDARWQRGLEAALAGYPYRKLVPQPNFFGIGVYSKIPFKKSSVHYQTVRSIPSVYLVFEHGGREFALWAAHTISPINRARWNMRRHELSAISEAAAVESRPVIVIGDLNLTPWSYWFGALKGRHLKDCAAGFGREGTWNAFLPFFLRIPIDHVLVSKDIPVTESRVLGDFGSDHRPLFVRVSL